MRASREAYPAKLVTAGVDIQKDHCVYSVREWPGNKDAEHLAPCPFCGSDDIDPHYITDGEIAPIHGDGAMPGCRSCGATAPSAEAWNRRTYSTPMRQQRLEEDAMKSDESEGRAGRAIDRAEYAEKLLWNVDAVARYRGDEHGVPDSIDEDGAAYQSQGLLNLLDQVDRRRSGVVAAHRLNRAAHFDFRPTWKGSATGRPIPSDQASGRKASPTTSARICSRSRRRPTTLRNGSTS